MSPPVSNDDVTEGYYWAIYRSDDEPEPVSVTDYGVRRIGDNRIYTKMDWKFIKPISP